MQTDGRTDMAKLIATYRNLAKEPKAHPRQNILNVRWVLIRCILFLSDRNQIVVFRQISVKIRYSGPSKVEHKPFQDAVRLPICSTFQLNGMSRTMLCAMPRSWFDFRIFIRVSNRIFLEFFVRVSSCSRNKPFDFRGSAVRAI
jgi:hypothetical protein